MGKSKGLWKLKAAMFHFVVSGVFWWREYGTFAPMVLKFVTFYGPFSLIRFFFDCIFVVKGLLANTETKQKCKLWQMIMKVNTYSNLTILTLIY